ncbi:MAG: hypothetical protein ACE5EE_00240 [Fidelibacterota bacterium]
MGLKSVPNREIEKLAGDMFEATVVTSQRSRQIVARRHALKEIREFEEEPNLMDEALVQEEDYIEEEKATTVALKEFLRGELKWKYSYSVEENEEI